MFQHINQLRTFLVRRDVRCLLVWDWDSKGLQIVFFSVKEYNSYSSVGLQWLQLWRQTHLYRLLIHMQHVYLSFIHLLCLDATPLYRLNATPLYQDWLYLLKLALCLKLVFIMMYPSLMMFQAESHKLLSFMVHSQQITGHNGWKISKEHTKYAHTVWIVCVTVLIFVALASW